MRLRALMLLIVLAAARTGVASEPIAFRIVAEYPHDRNAFTQGLLIHRGLLYESTGLRGRSDVRKVELASGRVLVRQPIAHELFGEGLARVGNRLYQLTWTSGVGYVYELDTLERVSEFRYPGEGWGLAYDGRLLWKSDGSSRLEQRAPFGFRKVGEIEVIHDGLPVKRLNELEFVDGALFANVWRTDRIVRIDPATGQVTGWLDLSGLLSAAERARADVLNGIAWNADDRLLLVTGKLWPTVFALELLDAK